MINNRWLRYLIFMLCACSMLIAAGIYSTQVWWGSERSIPERHQLIVISKGQSLYGLAAELEHIGVLSHSKLWVYYARFIKKTKINAGEFRLSASESPESLLELFSSSNVVQYKLTWVEGIRVQDAVATLQGQEKLVNNLPQVISVSNPQEIGVNVEHLEGWLYPDTYYYSAGDTALDIVLRAHNKMSAVLNEEWLNRAPNLPLETPYDALILASIVEKETGAPHEREEIAGVFIRRLKKGMRLQTDPTVIYGMGDTYTGNITRADLKKHTDYNTYTNHGLPPTPIALPGRAAIHAALNPAEGTSYYFVAKGDGTHYFSETLDEHINAVKAYQLKRKENYRSQYQKSEDAK